MPTLRALLAASLFVLASAGATACSKGEGESSAGAPDPAATTTTTTTTTAPTAGPSAADAAAKAKEIFATRCTPCHGAEGRGDGAASASLTPPPRNFHDAAWQASVTDDHIVTIIKVGGAAVGKSAAMPSNPDLNSQEAVVVALKDYVRALGKQP